MVQPPSSRLVTEATLPELARDVIGAALVAGPNVVLTVSDSADTITIGVPSTQAQTSTNAQTGTAYTLVAADAGKTVEMGSASANTVTVPANATVGFAVGTIVDVCQYGAGVTTVASASGVSVRAAVPLVLPGQYTQVRLRKRATDEWVLTGATVAAATGGSTTTPTLTVITAPAISGSPAVGVTLAVSTGTWSATPDSYTYQWKRSGVLISNATGATYQLTSLDVGSAITAVLVASKFGYNPSAPTSSAATGTVVAASTAPGPASVSNTGFAFVGAWQTVASPSESYSSTAGDTATISFTAGSGGSTFSLRGQLGNGNGAGSVAIDGGNPTSVSEGGTAASNATVWTSGTLAAGNHTIVVKTVTPDFSVMGAGLSNGVFIAPNTSAPVTGGGATASGQTIPSASAYSGYTRVLAQDFDTPAALGSFGSVYPGYNSYDGGTSAASGTVWSSATTLSVANSQLRMRQYKDSTGTYTPAVTPPVNGDVWAGQQYGKWIVRCKCDTPSTYWKSAWLLWPSTNNWSDGEIDFPEMFFDSKIRVNVHENTGNPVNNTGADSTVTFGDNAWHTVMIEIDPGSMKFSVDGNVFATFTDAKYIPKVPFRWALQNEMDPGTIPVGVEASIYIDWIAAYSRN